MDGLDAATAAALSLQGNTQSPAFYWVAGALLVAVLVACGDAIAGLEGC